MGIDTSHPPSGSYRLAALAAVGIVALGAAVAGGLLLLGDAGPAPVTSEAPRPPPAPSVPPAEAPPPAPPPAAPRDPPAVREARAREAASPNVTRLVPSRGRYVIGHAIEQQVPQLARCFQRRAAPAGPAKPVSRRSLVSPDSPGVLRLELEPQAGEIWILDAAVEEPGTGTAAELACARRALKGVALEVPGTTPGPRVSMPFPLP